MPAVFSNYEHLSEDDIGEESENDSNFKAALHECAYSFLDFQYWLKAAGIISAIILLLALEFLVLKYGTTVNEIERLTTINKHCMNAAHVPAPAAFQTSATAMQTLAAAAYTWQGCGHSALSARAQSCRFDLMLSAWLPERCYDVGLHEQFLTAGNYSWYGDAALADEVSEAQVRRGEHVYVYTRAEFQFAHCGYAGVMRARVYPRAVAVDDTLLDWPHTTHCARMLTDHELPRNISRTKVGFGRCGLPRQL